MHGVAAYAYSYESETNKDQLFIKYKLPFQCVEHDIPVAMGLLHDLTSEIHYSGDPPFSIVSG